MRGEVYYTEPVRSGGGITPAHAGRSTPAWGVLVQEEDHPRACGEKHMDACMARRPARITPAHAGRSHEDEEYSDIPEGSPPRMRGEAMPPQVAPPHARITPAHAGRRHCSHCPSAGRWDHPRACGEKGSIPVAAVCWAGSPPHMRGEAAKPAADDGAAGITPAHAGRSCHQPAEQSFAQDHPRACGEKLGGGPLLPPPLGSPPRMRGEVKLLAERFCNPGITPAHAGRSQSKRRHQHTH